MDSCFKIGLLGAGKIAISHAKAIVKRDNLNLVAVADIIEEKARDLTKEYGGNYYTDYNQMLDQENIDIAIITLPHFLHKKASIDCANKGCHILLEKPMAMDEEECDKIIDACAENNVKLLVGHVQGYQSVNTKAREIVEKGNLGQLLMIINERYSDYFTADRPEWFLKPEAAGGGIAMNLGAHSFEILQYLSGSKIKSVRATVGKHAKGIEVEGNGIIFTSLENGVIGTIVLSGYNSIPDQTTKLIFTKGMLELKYWPQKLTMKDQSGQIKEIDLKKENIIDKQLELFVDSIVQDKEPIVTGNYGKGIIKAIRAVYKSSTIEEEIIV